MQSILDSGYSWLLDSLKYQDGCLSIFLTELSRSAMPENKTEGAPLDNCFAVNANESSRKVCVKWERPITWQVVNESADAKEPDIAFKSHGFLSEIEKSQYFDYVKVRFGLKWSNTTGHLVKVVKLPIEVIHDSNKEEKEVYPRIQAGNSSPDN